MAADEAAGTADQSLLHLIDGFHCLAPLTAGSMGTTSFIPTDFPGVVSSPNRSRYSSLLIITSTCYLPSKFADEIGRTLEFLGRIGFAREYVTVEFPGHVLWCLVPQPLIIEFFGL